MKTPRDIDRLVDELKIDRELLLVMYTQRTVRDATRRYYIVKKDILKLAKEWRKGSTIYKLARRINFPSVLLGLMLAPEIKITRKQYWKYLRDPNSCPNKRLRKELKHVAQADIIYSPKGSEVQAERGKWGEGLLQNWLDRRHLKYRTEEDLRSTHKKTPDVLLDKPLVIDGTKVFWIESKASFGDEIELKKNVRRQLKPYTEIFGTGAVVYWFGFIEGIEPPEGIMLLDGTHFHDK
ncbi:MAG: C15orf41 family protein [Methanobacteriota archaeon]|nr:MAG: C15orf41 family protein [Euryarchaeota archaeon]